MAVFNERLRILRTNKKVMVKDMAAYLETVPRNYQRYENGTIEPNIRNLVALADYFNVSLDYLTGRTDNPEVNR